MLSAGSQTQAAQGWVGEVGGLRVRLNSVTVDRAVVVWGKQVKAGPPSSPSLLGPPHMSLVLLKGSSCSRWGYPCHHCSVGSRVRLWVSVKYLQTTQLFDASF